MMSESDRDIHAKATAPTPGYAEGLIEYLQATAPSWGMKLTMERLALVGQIAKLQRQRDDLLAALERVERSARSLQWEKVEDVLPEVRTAIAAARGTDE